MGTPTTAGRIDRTKRDIKAALLELLRDKTLYDLLNEKAPVISRRLKKAGGYGKDGRKGFETIITRLQSQCYVIISDFVYELDKNGNTYGWGVAEYSTPEKFMGKAFTGKVYKREPEESYERIFTHLIKILPDSDEQAIKKLLK